MNGLVFRANAAPTEGVPLPLALTGLPKSIEGHPCHYRRHKMLDVREFTHRGDGVRHNVTRERLAALVDAFQKRKAKGLRPFVSDRHTLEPKATENFGFVENLELSGDDLYADLQLIGDDALKLAARNNVSLLTVADALDSDGVKYPEAVHHIALTPNEALSDLGGFIRIAASAGGSAALEAQILDPAAAPSQEQPMLKPETLQKLRTRFKLPDDAPEAQVAEKAAEYSLAEPPADKTAEVAALSADVAKLTKERDDAAAKVLSLSASAPKSPDAVTLAMYQDNIAAKRENAIAAGAISEAEAKEFDKLIADASGQPTPLALSASTGGRPLAFALWDTIGRLSGTRNGIKSGNAVPRPATDGGLRLSADVTEDAAEVAKKAEAETRAWQDDVLRQRGLIPHAATA